MMTIDAIMINKLQALCPISFSKHMSFLCPFLDPHVAMHHLVFSIWK